MHLFRLFRRGTKFYEARTSFEKMKTDIETEEELERYSRKILLKKTFPKSRKGLWILQAKGEGLVEQKRTEKELRSFCIFLGNKQLILFTTINSLDNMDEKTRRDENFKAKKRFFRIEMKFPSPKLRKQKKNTGGQGNGDNVNANSMNETKELSKKKAKKEYVIRDNGLLIEFPNQNNILFGFKLMFRNKCMIDKKALDSPLSPRDIGLHFEVFHKRLIATEMNRLSFLTQANYDK